MDSYWEPASVRHHPIKYESENGVNYPFCTSENGGNNYGSAGMTFSEDDAEFAPKRVKPTRQDPLSHRIIEKRRRDRMNSCLADLSRLIPPQYQRKSRGRIEKTEIIEMAIKHIKNIQAKADGAAEPSSGGGGVSASAATARQCYQVDQYREGYHECLTTAVQFLIEVSAHFEELCYKMVSHLREHFNDVVKGDHCTTHNGGASNNFQQIKRRQQENGSPPSTTSSGPLNGMGQFLLTNGSGGGSGGGGATDPRESGGGGGTASSTFPTGNGGSGGTGPRVAHLCGSINGHSSSGSAGANAGSKGNCGGHPVGEGVPSSSDGQEMNCAKDLSCRGTNNNINSSAAGANTTTSTTAASMACVSSALSKDGCRKPPQQTPVITSTACSTSVQSSSTCSTNGTDLLVNVETESSSSAQDHGCVMDGGAGGLLCGRSVGSEAEGGHHVGGGGGADGLGKVHNLLESSCDGVEHHYKYKNYMQQRFTHERFHDEHIVSNSSNELHDHHDHPMPGPGPHAGAVGNGAESGALKRGAMAPPPVEPTDSNCSVDTFLAFNAKRAVAAAAMEVLKGSGVIGTRETEERLALMSREANQTAIKEEKMDTSPTLCLEAIGKGVNCLTGERIAEGSQQLPRVKAKARFASVPVPIFALHSHGAFYIPLTVDYDALVPYLGEVNLLDKNLASVKALHPVNINIYAPF